MPLPVRVWGLTFWPAFLGLLLLASLGGLAAATRFVVDARGELPVFFTGAIILPPMAASLAIVAAATPVPHADGQASRRLAPWSAGQRVLALMAAMAAVGVSAGWVATDGPRVLQNTALFFALGVPMRNRWPHAAVAVPWLWAIASLSFGLELDGREGTSWHWWAFVLGERPQPLLAMTVAVVVSLLPPLPGRKGRGWVWRSMR